MIKKIVLLIILAFLVINLYGWENIKLNGKMSEVNLVYVGKKNYIISENKKNIYQDGLIFYFVIYKNNKIFGDPTLKELRDFKINKVSYRSETKKLLNIEIEPNTTAFSIENLIKSNPEEINYIIYDKEKDPFILQTTICGYKLPEKGKCEVTLYFGFNKEIEPFTFTFNLSDIKKNNGI